MENYKGNGSLEKLPKIMFVATRPDGRYVPMTIDKIMEIAKKKQFLFLTITDDGTVLTKEQIDNLSPEIYRQLEDYQKEDLKLKSKA